MNSGRSGNSRVNWKKPGDGRGNNRDSSHGRERQPHDAEERSVRRGGRKKGKTKSEYRGELAPRQSSMNRPQDLVRPRWQPVKLPGELLPSPACPLCGQSIGDIAAALTDKDTGVPVHFDCIIARIAENESLERGDAVAYIGGGRFGVVHFPSAQDSKNFKIKKTLEWENKEQRSEWRQKVADHFSVT